MNDLELAITATLRADAQEAAMSTDTSHEYQLLEGRMDDLDARRRRRVWVVAVAAAAAAVLVVFGLRALSPVSDAHPVAPTPPPVARYSTVQLVPTTSFTIPAAIKGAKSILSTESTSAAVWQTGACSDNTCDSTSANLVLVNFTAAKMPKIAGYEDPVAIRSGADYLKYLRRLETAGYISITESAPVVVGGLSGTVISMTENEQSPEGMGCSGAPLSCLGLDKTWIDRAVVLDYPGSALTLWMSAPQSNPDFPTLRRQFEQMLPTVRFGPVPSPGTS